jgi:isopenicillin N synthase-like dioxygenase
MRNSAARLPVIDLAVCNALEPAAAAHLLDAAASEYGFFYIIGHGIAQRGIDSLIAQSRTFFSLEVSAKERIHMSLGGRAWRGWFPVGGELTSGRPDLKEGVYFGEEVDESDPRVRAGLPLHGRNLFPDLPGFRDAVLEYMGHQAVLGQRVMALLGLGLGLPADWFATRYTSQPTILFRIFHYPPSRASADAEPQGVGEHTDYGLLTLLYQDDVGGLQVKHESGWIDVPHVPGSFVVNVGDMLERLTSGRYRSALHRVINRSRRSRISMPFFFDPQFDAQLRPLEGLRPAVSRSGLIARWDGLDLRDLRGTYGDYLIAKVSKVFPELGRAHLAQS